MEVKKSGTKATKTSQTGRIPTRSIKIWGANVLTCLPQSICSWDFNVFGAAAGPSALTFNFFTESGGIQHGLIHHEVRKQGLWSGHLTLERHGQVIAEARKHSFLRRFDLTVGHSHFIVQAETVFSRDFEILCGGSVAGTIRPAHPFTRRSFLRCSDVVPEACQLFAFWLAALTWKRAAQSQAS